MAAEVMEKLSGVFPKISFQKKEGQEVFVDMGVAAFMKKGLDVAECKTDFAGFNSALEKIGEDMGCTIKAQQAAYSGVLVLMVLLVLTRTLSRLSVTIQICMLRLTSLMTLRSLVVSQILT